VQVGGNVDLATHPPADGEEVDHVGHVVHPEDRGAGVDAFTDGSQRPGEARHRPAAGQRSHEVLPGDSEEDRSLEPAEFGQAAEDVHGLARRLGEVRARIDDHLVGPHPARPGQGEPLLEKGHDIGHHVS
jgi:hypothetical protein